MLKKRLDQGAHARARNEPSYRTAFLTLTHYVRAPGDCSVARAPLDIRALAADAVRTVEAGLALQAGASSLAFEDDVELPACIQARLSRIQYPCARRFSQ